MMLIALYKGRGWLSRLIRWRTWSEYSHAAWVRDDGTVIESWTPGGVRHVASLSEAHSPGTEVVLYQISTEVDYQSVEQFLLSQLGKPYDYWGILGFMLRRRSERKRAWFCSELVFEAVRRGGVQLLNGVEPWRVSPGDLATSPLLKVVGRRITRDET